jgi:TolB-like protein/Flp pilus assembly protein TadD
MIGTTVSHYRIVELLGEGGMGVVYKADDLKLQRTVALKFLPAAMTRDEEAKTRFLTEARAASALDHPSVCTIHEIDETPDGRLFICMALYDGGTVRDRIREGALPIEDAVRLARQAAEGLAKAHASGVVHRDIKPENLFLTRDGQVKILDFGLAKLGATSQLTMAGTAMGTAAYMSPEQARGEEVDGRTDVWSLGLVLYEMLAGSRPFRSDYEQALVYSILNEDPEPVTARRADVPESVAAVVERCLQKDRARRYGSAEELAAALRAIESPGATGPVPVAPPARRAFSLRHALIAGGVLLAAAGILVGGKVLVSRSGAPKRPMLAVLPLGNRGPAEDEYFADGITDAITARLAGIHGLGVISRQSAMQYKNSTKTTHEIGGELGAAYILVGTVQRERPSDPKSRLRIIPNLVRVKDDSSIWADTYDEDMTELFRVQSEIAERVARALDITLLEPERRNVESKPTEILEAYEYFLRGGDYYRRRLTEEDSRNAVAMYEKAVALDPSFAEAWAALARSRIWLKWNYGHEGELARAEEAVEKARELKPDAAETHMALGEFYYYGSRDYTRALEHFTTVQRRQPSEVDAISNIGWIQRRLGDWEDAVTNLRMAIELSPRDPTLNHTLGQTLARMHRYEEAEGCLDRAISLLPGNVFPYIDKAILYLDWDGGTERASRVLDEGSSRILPSEFLGPTPLFLIRILPESFERICAKIGENPQGVDTASDSIYCHLYRAEVLSRGGDRRRAEAQADTARSILERSLQRQPNTAYLRGLLGLADAASGRNEEAIREGREAVELLPLSKDAVSGAYRLEEYAQICAKAGDFGTALDQIEILLSTPSRVSPAVLRLDPIWEPVRDEARFRRLVEAPHGHP